MNHYFMAASVASRSACLTKMEPVLHCSANSSEKATSVIKLSDRQKNNVILHFINSQVFT